MAETKFLITGATGRTGGYAIRLLLEKKHAVRVLAHRIDDRSKQLQELGRWHRPSDRSVRAGFRGSRATGRALAELAGRTSPRNSYGKKVQVLSFEKRLGKERS